MKKLALILTVLAFTSASVVVAGGGDKKDGKKSGCCSKSASACVKGEKGEKSAKLTTKTKGASVVTKAN